MLSQFGHDKLGLLNPSLVNNCCTQKYQGPISAVSTISLALLQGRVQKGRVQEGAHSERYEITIENKE